MGAYRVRAQRCLTGEALPHVSRIHITAATQDAPPGSQPPAQPQWSLRGITSNERYVTRSEKNQLAAIQQSIGAPGATFAALIPIRKSPEWWALTQDERREVLQEQSRHIEIGLRYAGRIARRLHHCRDFSESEPFDFITWFEYQPADERAFDDLLGELRATEEWRYVDSECELRLSRDAD